MTGRKLSKLTLLTMALAVTLLACDELGGSPEESDQDPRASGDTDNLAEAIPLIDWVDLLVEDYSAEGARPDTVRDKNIIDDQQAGSFEKFFATPQD
jgi:hypothetical protein